MGQIENYKPYLKIIAEEVNVTKIEFLIAKTEKGNLSLVYYLEKNNIALTLNNISIQNDKLEKFIYMYLDKIFNKVKKYA